jgi:hypothetical protein
MCDACCKNAGVKECSSKGLEGKTVAYLCASCGEFCYRENGLEAKYTDEAEVKALKVIETELKKCLDKSQSLRSKRFKGWGISKSNRLRSFYELLDSQFEVIRDDRSAGASERGNLLAIVSTTEYVGPAGR